jgi:hypothetical protein
MKIEIAQREKYSIAVDSDKNRAYYTMTGFWQNPEDFPYYLQDWEKAFVYLKKGFTVLADLRNSKPPGPKVKALLETAQQKGNEHGMRKNATLVATDALFTGQSIDKVANRSGMINRSFKELSKAEAWLDED